MSAVAIRAALEQAAAAASPTLQSAYENEGFAPEAGTPYQKVDVLFAKPDNREISRNFVEQGFMQISLMYPQTDTNGASQGWNPAITQADAIRSALYKGRTLTQSGINILLTDTAEIAPGIPDGDRFMVPVRVPFRAQVTG